MNLGKETETTEYKKSTGVWDSAASDKSVVYVNEEQIKEYLDRANAAGRVVYKYTSKKDTLNMLNLINGNNITNTAKVMFCDDVNLEIQMAIFATDEKITFYDINRANGTVPELVDIGEKYIKNNINCGLN